MAMAMVTLKSAIHLTQALTAMMRIRHRPSPSPIRIVMAWSCGRTGGGGSPRGGDPGSASAYLYDRRVRYGDGYCGYRRQILMVMVSLEGDKNCFVDSFGDTCYRDCFDVSDSDCSGYGGIWYDSEAVCESYASTVASCDPDTGW